MIDFIGTILLWIIAAALTATFPFSEFARGMATNPAAHKPSRGAMAMSLVGVLLIVGLLNQ